MTRLSAITAGSLALWGVWLLGSIVGSAVEFDGLAFLVAVISTSQVIMLATRNPQVDAFRALLASQCLLNVGTLIALGSGLDSSAIRAVLIYATLGQLVVAYTIFFRIRKSVG